jgi:anti-anti-sigma regulatory factor
VNHLLDVVTELFEKYSITENSITSKSTPPNPNLSNNDLNKEFANFNDSDLFFENDNNLTKKREKSLYGYFPSNNAVVDRVANLLSTRHNSQKTLNNLNNLNSYSTFDTSDDDDDDDLETNSFLNNNDDNNIINNKNYKNNNKNYKDNNHNHNNNIVENINCYNNSVNNNNFYNSNNNNINYNTNSNSNLNSYLFKNLKKSECAYLANTPYAVIIHMNNVMGIDASAMDTFSQICTICLENKCRLVFAATKPSDLMLLKKTSLFSFTHVFAVVDLDSSLSLMEDAMLNHKINLLKNRKNSIVFNPLNFNNNNLDDDNNILKNIDLNSSMVKSKISDLNLIDLNLDNKTNNINNNNYYNNNNNSSNNDNNDLNFIENRRNFFKNLKNTTSYYNKDNTNNVNNNYNNNNNNSSNNENDNKKIQNNGFIDCLKILEKSFADINYEAIIEYFAVFAIELNFIINEKICFNDDEDDDDNKNYINYNLNGDDEMVNNDSKNVNNNNDNDNQHGMFILEKGYIQLVSTLFCISNNNNNNNNNNNADINNSINNDKNTNNINNKNHYRNSNKNNKVSVNETESFSTSASKKSNKQKINLLDKIELNAHIAQNFSKISKFGPVWIFDNNFSNNNNYYNNNNKFINNFENNFEKKKKNKKTTTEYFALTNCVIYYIPKKVIKNALKSSKTMIHVLELYKLQNLIVHNQLMFAKEQVLSLMDIVNFDG